MTWLIRSIPVCSVFLTVQCVSFTSQFNNELASRYKGPNPLCISKDSLLAGIAPQLIAFNDTTSIDTIKDLWYSLQGGSSPDSLHSSQTETQDVSKFAAVLTHRGYCVATLNPPTFEGIFALSKSPILLWILLIHYPANQTGFIDDNNLSVHSLVKFSRYAQYARLHLISGISINELGYRISLSDGLVFGGGANDNMRGLIFSHEPKNLPASYVQVIDCFLITALPLLEIREHIDDWYSSMPYNNLKPAPVKFE